MSRNEKRHGIKPRVKVKGEGLRVKVGIPFRVMFGVRVRVKG